MKIGRDEFRLFQLLFSRQRWVVHLIPTNAFGFWNKKRSRFGNKGRKTKIANEDKFRKFVREHSDKTQKRM
ncbi:MAG: hypothetical protein WBM86_10755 [Waterburya sp.]